LAALSSASAPEVDKTPIPAAFRHAGAVAIAGSIIVLGYRFFHFIWRYSVNVLFFDQWDIFADLFQGTPTLTQLFLRQQGPPREGVGLAADKSHYALTHWNVRAESFLIGSCIFIAMLLALVLKRKLFGRSAFSDVSIPMMFLTLVQFETMVGTPNAAYSWFPLLFIMLYSLALY
jgi:hypothetical protein